MDKRIILSRLLLIWHTLLFASIIFSFRAISSLCIGLMLTTGIYYYKAAGGYLLSKKKVTIPYILFAGCFFWQFYSLVCSGYAENEWKEIQLKSGLLLIPLTAIFSKPLYDSEREKLNLIFLAMVSTGCLYLLASAGVHFFTTGETTCFFYHDFTAPINQHAVYFSFLVFLALVILLEHNRKNKIKILPVLRVGLVLFLSLILFLLSSKLFILIYLVYLLYYILLKKQQPGKKKRAWGLAVCTFITFLIILFATPNAISSRFREILNGRLTIMQNQHFNPAQYFNGLQFRLLQWKLVPSILNQRDAWLTGVGNENAQLQLNEQYKKLDMYAGQPGTQDKGYMQYNTHNQFLESLLRNGLVGFLLIFFLFISLLSWCHREKNGVMTICIIALLCFSFTESLLETQYGILFLSFFPFWLSRD